jgi:hypothetical protein
MWETGDLTPDKKHFIYHKHNIVAIRFSNVIEHEFNGFNVQNVIVDWEVASFKDEASNACYEVCLPAIWRLPKS